MLCFWTHILTDTPRPSEHIRSALAGGMLMPEWAALIGVPQDPERHPEGSVWEHTMHCVDAFATTRTGDYHEDVIVGLAVLCHDLGKRTETRLIDGRWTSHGHEAAGEAPTRAFLAQSVFPLSPEDVEAIVALVVNHMRPTFLYRDTGGKVALTRSVRRLAREVSLNRLARVVWCDKAGRPPKPQVSPEAEWLKACAVLLAAEPVPPPKVKCLIQGQDLLDAGIPQGPRIGHILQLVAFQQSQEYITTKEQAWDYVKRHLTLNPL